MGQERYWIPRDPNEFGRHIRKPEGIASHFPASFWWIIGGSLPKTFYYFEIVMGWILASIGIAGFSKYLSRDMEERD